MRFNFFKFLLSIALGTCIFVMFLLFFNFSSSNNKVIIINKNATANQVANILKNQEIINNTFSFKVILKLFALERKIIPGEFHIPKGTSLFSLVFYITDPKNIHNYTITLVDGYNKRQIIRTLKNNPHLQGDITIDFEEGTLMPDTYFFEKGQTRDSIILRSKQTMERYLDKLWQERDLSLPYKNKKEALIMASLIEKEAALKSERDLIAGVFINRLNKGMRLQTDPTVAYGLGRDNADKLTRSDLRSNHPYNTYLIQGLPIGPIANPSRGSLQAAFNPKETDYIYFVANGKGGHWFSITLKEHNRKVAKWREIEKEIRKQEG